MSGDSTSAADLRFGLRQALDRYFLLLFMILATIAASAVLRPVGWGALVLVSLQSATALLAVSTSESPHLTRVLVRITASVALGLVALAALLEEPDLTRIAFATGMFVLVTIVPITVLRRLAHHRRVTIQTVMGVLCIYLLVGLLYAVLFGTYHHFSGGFFEQRSAGSPADFIYFSFVTLTTVGYGDFVPADPAARMLAISEALIGQLYLVTVVALTVSNIGLEQRAKEQGDEARKRS